MALIKQITKIVSAGETSLSVTDDAINDSSTIKIITDPYGIVITGATQTEHTAVISFVAQAAEFRVRLDISNVDSFDVEDSLESTSETDALSANQGKELNDKIDDLPDIVSLDPTSGQILAYNATQDLYWNVDNDAHRVGFTDVTHQMESDNVRDAIVEAYNHGGGGSDDNYGTKAEFEAVKDSLPIGSAFDIVDDGESNRVIYDDTEREVGTWFGKTLYRKTFVKNNIGIPTSSTGYDFGIPNDLRIAFGFASIYNTSNKQTALLSMQMAHSDGSTELRIKSIDGWSASTLINLYVTLFYFKD